MAGFLSHAIRFPIVRPSKATQYPIYIPILPQRNKVGGSQHNIPQASGLDTECRDLGVIICKPQSELNTSFQRNHCFRVWHNPKPRKLEKIATEHKTPSPQVGSGVAVW